MVIGNSTYAGAAATGDAATKLAISMPVDTRTNADRMRYTTQVDPKRALRKPKRLVERRDPDTRVLVMEDANLFADFDINIPNVGRHFGLRER